MEPLTIIEVCRQFGTPESLKLPKGDRCRDNIDQLPCGCYTGEDDQPYVGFVSRTNPEAESFPYSDGFPIAARCHGCNGFWYVRCIGTDQQGSYTELVSFIQVEVNEYQPKYRAFLDLVASASIVWFDPAVEALAQRQRAEMAKARMCTVLRQAPPWAGGLSEANR